MTPTSSILIDANIFMYSVGRPHRLRDSSRQVVLLAAEHEQSFFTDAEVFQELLHRYMAVRAWPLMRPHFDGLFTQMRGRIEPMLAEDVEHAAALAERYPALSARDLVHAAVMYRVGATHVVSADGSFDVLTDIERLDPAEVDVWRDRVRDVAR